MTEREELARIFDPGAFELLLADLDDNRQSLVLDRRSDALAKADQWLSRPSPVDEVVEALRAIATEPADDGHGPEQGPAFLWVWAQARARLAITAYDKAKGETQ